MTAKKQTQNDVRSTLEQRGSVHGDYALDANCGMNTVNLWMIQENWDRLGNTKKHALTMIAFKVARILHGNPNHKDHWHDIAGYATLAEDRCE